MDNDPDKLDYPPCLGFHVRSEDGFNEGHSSDAIIMFIFAVYIKAHTDVGFWGISATP